MSIASPGIWPDTGEPTSEGNIRLEHRSAEVRSMRLEIAALQVQPDDTSIIHGSGVCGDLATRVSLRPVAITARPGAS